MKTIKALIKEIIPVVIGILLALFINNWNEDRKDRNYLNKMLVSIEKELAASKLDIEEKLVGQNRLIDTLNFYLNDTNVSLIEIINKSRGLKIPAIKINSWKAISNSNIQLVDHDRISTLSSIEEGKQVLFLQAEKLSDFGYQNFYESSKKKKELMRIYLMDLIYTEDGLIKEIDLFNNN